MRLVIATRNRHKLAEIRAILQMPGLEILDVYVFPNVPEVDEDGDTFEANALKKAVAVARSTGEVALADDSGLEIDALRGAPGVRSARYAGEPVNYDANNRKVLAEMDGLANRRARFHCVIAIADPAGRTVTVHGQCAGHIAEEPRGTRGFGYDPIFIPLGYKRTFAELESEEKNRISHRAGALRAARKVLERITAHGAVDPVSCV